MASSNIKSLLSFVVGIALSGAGVWLAQQSQPVPGVITLLIGAFLMAKALK